MAKHRSSLGSRRPVENIEVRKRFFIVCEGEKTEPSYFRNFKAPTSIIEIRGEGCNTTALIRKCIEYKEENGKEYDEYWVVFDRDSFLTKHYNEAIKNANENNIEIAFSNEAFELWYVLHFNYLVSSTPRDQLIRMIEQHFQIRYSKGKTNMWPLLEKDIKKAIKNSQQLYDEYESDHALQNPCTRIHVLVKKLMSASNRFDEK